VGLGSGCAGARAGDWMIAGRLGWTRSGACGKARLRARLPTKCRTLQKPHRQAGALLGERPHEQRLPSALHAPHRQQRPDQLRSGRTGWLAMCRAAARHCVGWPSQSLFLTYVACGLQLTTHLHHRHTRPTPRTHSSTNQSTQPTNQRPQNPNQNRCE